MSIEETPRPGSGVVYKKASSLRSDGSRNFVYPADVAGRFDRRRKVAYVVLIALLAALPWIEVGGHPAIFLDMLRRRFFLFGHTFNAQDAWLLFFILSGVGYGLIVMTALWGRVWCGYACPQTVFLEGLFRPVERLIEGPRSERMRRAKGPMNFAKAWRLGLKHGIYLLLAFMVAHIVISYFVSLPVLYDMVLSAPSAHPEAFAWALSLTGVLYLDFAWFREQTCLIVCPYGRLQSVLTDRDTLVIGYDEGRGEPRGKAKDPNAGDCVSCNRCVTVCPTGIDIRNGLQMDCIGCARCIDACDDVMVKLKRKPGLVRYDSLKGLEGKADRADAVARPRLYLYAAFGVAGLVAATIGFRSSRDFEANLMRLRSLPYEVEGERVRNAFELHLVNKRASATAFEILGQSVDGIDYTVSVPRMELPSLKSQRVPVFVTYPVGLHPDLRKAVLQVRVGQDATRIVTAPLLGPAP